ncbi:hypothetical protein [Mycobacteroides salmoniphilum]|uniref:Uncharacterized protein n=1 Tax=Mycobacteroides salmoniphilum TaxID=404941 RepID=A0A4R8SE20_9MYCO|nr:hypothetical protein [Mycobacteroides salmoniphilum]TDZ93730.1 hypothetical protein CCUG60885_03334 [Mycobacteroides salmoniphilum]TEA09513.1 hypothetical protein CCUG60883_00275 [Mycobacteroides salmoniphilum]
MASTKNWRRFLRRPFSNLNSEDSRTPLREFAYLDEVSLTSLLSSQTGEITFEILNATTESQDAQRSASSSGNLGVVKNEFASRYQTSNSKSIHTTRKSNVQSLFREFHSITQSTLLARYEKEPSIGKKSSPDEVIGNIDLCTPIEYFKRGSLIELTVELDVDPIFKVSTMMSELRDLSSEYEDVFNYSLIPADISGTVQILERLLTGLIPIRGTSVNLVVFEKDKKQYVTHRNVARHLGVQSEPLVIVGVTEHLCYWKDIRRVLFSKSAYTILCRLSRDGIQSEWTPVKLAELFKDVAPDMKNALSELSLLSNTALSPTGHTVTSPLLADTLRNFTEKLSADRGIQTTSRMGELEAVYALSGSSDSSITAQREAFDSVLEILGITLDSDEYLKRRRAARESTGLTLFQDTRPYRHSTTKQPQGQPEAMLDCEPIAIYW